MLPSSSKPLSLSHYGLARVLSGVCVLANSLISGTVQAHLAFGQLVWDLEQLINNLAIQTYSIEIAI